MNLVFTYGGLVEGNKDPLKLGRLKVRVPHVFGSTGGGSGFVATNALPWAMPAGMPAGGSAQSGGFSQIPAVGDKVWVRFLDGEPEKPIWEWGMQSMSDAKTLALHSYETSADGSVGDPDRTVWTRYSHAIELNAGGIIETTSGGYRLLLNDSSTPTSFDGSIKLSTPAGNMLEIDDDLNTLTLNILEDVNFQIGNSFLATSFDYSWNTTGDYSTDVGKNLSATAAGTIDFSCVGDYSVDGLAGISLSAATVMDLSAGGDLSVTAGGAFSLDSTGLLDLTGSAALNLTAGTLMNLTSTGAMSLNFSLLSFGTASSEPFVLGNQLAALLTSFLLWADTHTHSNGDNGSPTGPPIVPTTGAVLPLPVETISQTIFGH